MMTIMYRSYMESGKNRQKKERAGQSLQNMQNQEGLQETGAGALTPAVKSSWAEIIGNQLCGKTIFNNCS